MKLWGLGCAWVVVPGTGWAQQPEGDVEAVEEIVVTSQRRQERLVDVPLSVSAFSGDFLEQSFAFNLESLERLVPSLSFRKGTTTRNSALVLRGIGTISFSIAAEPSVSTVVDGVVMARSGQAFADMYDLERIEVLRGPQGTLFGKNASAGLINMTTRRPSDELEAEVELSAFEDDEYRARLSVAGALSDSMRVRITGFFGSFDGHIRNVFLRENVNGYSRQGVRGLFELTPLEDLTLTFIADYGSAGDDCCAEVVGTPPADPSSPEGFAVNDALANARPRGDEGRRVSQNLRTQNRDETYGFSLQADWALGDLTLTSITAFRRWDNTEIRDGDFLSVGASAVGSFNANNAFVNAPFELHDRGVQEFRQFSQELRLASPAEQFIAYQGGLFFFRVESDRTFNRRDALCTASTLPVDGRGVQPCLEGASTFAFPEATAEFGSTFTNYAAFGQVTGNLGERVRVLAGARLTRDEVSFFHQRQNPSGLAGPGVRLGTFPPPELGRGDVYRDETDAWGVSARVVAQYRFLDSTQAFASYARGYKGPAFNVFFNFTENNGAPLDPETSDAFELGLKGSVIEDRVYFSLTGFYQLLDNFQANNFVELGGTTITTLDNAGEVFTRGFELETRARPVSNLELSGSVAFADARVDAFDAAEGGTDRADEELPLSPDWMLTFTGDYRLPFEVLPFFVDVGTQFSWRSEQFSDFGEDPALRIAPYGIWDATLRFTSSDQRVSVAMLVRNILDDSFASLITSPGPGRSTRFLIPREAQRYVGASLRVKL